jgi:branched-chain amino acid aminotransferase
MADKRFEQGCAWVDGGYVPLSEARVPIIDMGFLRSDVTYDVVSVWKGQFFRLDDHFARFEASWTSLHMNPRMSTGEMREILFQCVRHTGIRDAYVAMILTRGIAQPGVRDPRVIENRYYAYAVPYVWLVKPEAQETTGIHLVIANTSFRIPPSSVDPTVKNFHWGDMVRGVFEAYERGGESVLLTDAQGTLTEGPGFNLFIWHQGKLQTPANGVLHGITRRTVMELAAEQGLETQATDIHRDQLSDAEEVFITSTAGGVMPVTKLDGKPVGAGKPGKRTLALRQRYWDAHEEARWATPVTYDD